MKIKKKFLAVITTLGILITGMGINSFQPVHAAESDVVKTIEIKHMHSGLDYMGGCYTEIKCGETLTKKVTETKCWRTTTLAGYGTLYDGYGNPKSEQGYTQRVCSIHGVVEQNSIVGFTTTGYCPVVTGTKNTYYCATHNDQEYTESGTCQTVTGHQLTCEDTTNTVIARITLNKSYDANDRYLITPVLTYSSPKYTNAVYTWDDTDEEVLNVTGNGNHILKIAYRDSGSDREKEIAVTVSDYDTEAPVITDLTQSPATPTKGPVTITVTATDNYKVKYYRLGLNEWQTSNEFEATTNGRYAFTVKDAFGNESSTKYIEITNIDKTPPKITITDQPSELTNESVVVTYELSDNMSASSKIKSVVTKSDVAPDVISGNSTIFSADENGKYYIHAEDEAGNRSTLMFNVANIDKKPPVLTVDDYDKTWTNQYVLLNYSATDNNGTVYYAVSTESNLTKDQINEVNTSKKIEENGIYYVYARDLAGNIVKKMVEIINIDKEPPVINVEPFDTSWTKESVTITFSATDNSGDTIYYAFSGNGQLGADEINGSTRSATVTENRMYYIYAKDKAGNVARKEVAINNIDKVPPVITVNPFDTSWTKESVTITFSATDNSNDTIYYAFDKNSNLEASGITGTDKTATVTENGIYYVFAKDKAGNVAKKSVEIKNIDREAPVITIEPMDSEWTNISVTVKFSATDDSNDTIYYAFSKNPNLTGTDINGTDRTATVTENGIYYVYARDLAGNVAKKEVEIYQLDKEPPVLTVNPYDTSWTKESVTITFSATDNSNTTIYYAFSQNPGLTKDEITGTSTTATASENGTYYVYARDKAGNIAKKEVVINNIDKEPPVITVEPINSNWTKESVTITFSATDNSNDTIYYAFSNSGSLSSADITGSGKTATVTENGTYYVYAKDKAGNIAKKEVVVTTIDKEAPVITINPYDTSWTKESVTITFSATDNSNDTIYYAFSKNSSLSPALVTGTETSAVVTENGTYYVYAIDLAGNMSSESVTITNIDKAAPVITVGEISKEYTKDDVTVTWTAKDDCSTKIYFAFTKNPVLEDTLVNEEITEAVVTENDVYYIYAKDEAGNVAKKSVVITCIDKEPPSVEVELRNGRLFKDADEKEWTDKVTAIVTATDNVALHAKPYQYDEADGFVKENKHEYIKNGTFTIVVRDQVGNEATEEITIENVDEYEPIVDSVNMKYTKPNKEVVEVPLGTVLTDVNMISLIVTAHDEQSAVESYRLKDTKGNYTSWQTSNEFKEIYLNGHYEIEVKDKCGNIKVENISITTLSEKFEVIYRDICEDKVLGEVVKLMPIGSSVSGAEMGIDPTVGAYYPGYSFVSCSTAIVTTGENVVTRIFKLNTCTITFHDAEGKVIFTDKVVYGEACGYNYTPNKDTYMDDVYEYNYTFEKWVDNAGKDVNLLKITKDLSLYPKFTEFKTEITFAVKFVANKKTIAVEYVKKGQSVTPPDAPEIEDLKFIEWDKDLSNIQSNMTVTAIYQKKKFGSSDDGIKEKDDYIPPTIDYTKFKDKDDVEYIVQEYQKPKEEVKPVEKPVSVIPSQRPQKKQTVAQSIKRLYTDEKTKTAAITTTVVLGTASLWLIISYILYAIGGLTLLQLFLFWLALLFKRRRYIAGAWLTEDANTRYVDRYGRRVVMEETGDGRLQFRRGKKILRTIVVDKLLDDLNAGKITYSEFESIIKASQVYTSFSKNLEIEVSSAKSRRRAETRKVSGFSLTKCIKSALDVADEYRVRIKNGAESILFDLKYSDPL